MSRSARTLLILAVAGGLSAGCATARAQVAQLPTTIDTPAPPPRVVIPESLEPDPVPPAPAPAPAPADPAPARPARPTTSQPRQTPAADPPPAPAPTQEPPAVLQTANNARDAAAMEQRTNQRLAAARKDLGDVRYPDLSVEAKAQFDRAQGLIRQAENALKVKNYVFAEELAGKAATLATQLRKISVPTFS